MFFDIIILLILVGSAAYGFKKGFVFTLIHTVGWVGALALAYLVTPYLGKVLKNYTALYQWLLSGFQSRLDITLDSLDIAMESLPENISSSISSSSDIIGGISESIANITFVILTFVIAFIILKVVLLLILKFFSKDYKSGFGHFFDGFFGLLFGLLKGAVIIIIIFALLVPIIGFLPIDTIASIETSLNSSFIAGTLYNNNFLLLLLQNYFN